MTRESPEKRRKDLLEERSQERWQLRMIICIFLRQETKCLTVLLTMLSIHAKDVQARLLLNARLIGPVLCLLGQ